MSNYNFGSDIAAVAELLLFFYGNESVEHARKSQFEGKCEEVGHCGVAHLKLWVGSRACDMAWSSMVSQISDDMPQYPVMSSRCIPAQRGMMLAK